MTDTKDVVKDQKALEKFKLISPLLDSSLDQAEKIAKRKDIASANNISIRTVYRYEETFRKKGFSGLKPKERTGQVSSLPPGYDEILKEAIFLKREVPSRSVALIIFILESEGKVEKGVLKRSTLQKKLFQAGLGKKHLKHYDTDKRLTAARRFCKAHRMMLVQADIKYGVGIVIKENGKKQTLYLSSIIDDHSRFILCSEWYDTMEQETVTNVFRKAILMYGKFDAAYTDNGSQYISKDLKLSCAKLGISLKRAPVRSGKSKGKIEKFHQVVDAFIAEIKLKKPTSTEEVNRYWNIFLEEYYHKKPHDGIREYYESNNLYVPPEGITPEQEWNSDSRPLMYFDTAAVAEAFRRHEKRTVNSGAQISFDNHMYEADAGLIGHEVEISYDPNDKSEIIIYSDSLPPITSRAKPIGEWCEKTPPVPVSLQENPPEDSRLLNAIENIHEQKQKKLADAISYTDFLKEDK